MTAQYTFVMKDLRKIVPPKREILKGIWLSFYPGAKIGVLGNNGAGKSTLLKIMAGADKEFLGEAWPAPGLKIGYLPQEPQLDPKKTSPTSSSRSSRSSSRKRTTTTPITSSIATCWSSCPTTGPIRSCSPCSRRAWATTTRWTSPGSERQLLSDAGRARAAPGRLSRDPRAARRRGAVARGVRGDPRVPDRHLQVAAPQGARADARPARRRAA